VQFLFASRADLVIENSLDRHLVEVRALLATGGEVTLMRSCLFCVKTHQWNIQGRMRNTMPMTSSPRATPHRPRSLGHPRVLRQFVHRFVTTCLGSPARSRFGRLVEVRAELEQRRAAQDNPSIRAPTPAEHVRARRSYTFQCSNIIFGTVGRYIHLPPRMRAKLMQASEARCRGRCLRRLSSGLASWRLKSGFPPEISLPLLGMLLLLRPDKVKSRDDLGLAA
jgi:hypothetical protein